MEQEANYKVNIDTADLQAQLANIRSMLDQTFQSQMLSANIPTPQPTSFAYPTEGVNNAIGAISQDASSISGGASSALSSLNMGMQKFRESAIGALMSPGPSFGGPMPSERNIPDFKQMGSMQSFGASTFGLGYDPSMSMTRGAYKEKADEQFGHTALGFGLDIGSMGAGSLIGKTFGSAIVGGAVGLGVSMLAKPVLDATALYDYNSANEIKSYARDTSWRFLSGKFSNEDASRVGVELSTVQRSKSMVGDRIGASDVQRLLGEFTEAGAFDYVRSAEDYVSKAKGLIENHRKVMQILRVSEQEAVAAWSQVGTVGAAAAVQGMAYTAGMTSSELMQWGSSSMEMVRGTGINLSSAYQGGMQTIVDVKGMLASGDISGQLGMQLGGAQGIAGYMQQVGYQWGNSLSGFTQLTAAGGYNGDFNAWVKASPYETMSNAMGQNASIGDFLENKGGMAATLSQMSPETMYGMQGLQFLKEMQFQTGNGALTGGISQNKFVGWMEQKYGMSDPQARLMWSTLTSNEDPRVLAMSQRAEAVKNLIDSQPSMIDSALDATGNFFGAMSEPFTNVAMDIANAMGRVSSKITKSWNEYKAGASYGLSPEMGKALAKTLKFTKEEIDEGMELTALRKTSVTNAWNAEKDSSGVTNKEKLQELNSLLGDALLNERDSSTRLRITDDAVKYKTNEEFRAANQGLTITDEEINSARNPSAAKNRTLAIQSAGGVSGIKDKIKTMNADLSERQASSDKANIARELKSFGFDTIDRGVFSAIGNAGLKTSEGAHNIFGTSILGEAAAHTAGVLGFGGSVLAGIGTSVGLMDYGKTDDEANEKKFIQLAQASQMEGAARSNFLSKTMKMNAANIEKFEARLPEFRKMAAAAMGAAFSTNVEDRDKMDAVSKNFDVNMKNSEQLGAIKEQAKVILSSMGASEEDLKGGTPEAASKATLAMEQMNAQSLKQISSFLGEWLRGKPAPVYMSNK